MAIKKFFPWWVRIITKILLAKLPISYSFWKKIRLFEHGDMNQPNRAFDIFFEHAKTADILDLSANDFPKFKILKNNQDFTVLEIGPGDSLFTGVIAYSFGATKSWLVDTGPFASNEMRIYRQLIEFLETKGYRAPKHSISQLKEVLSHCGCEYLTNGVDSLATIPSSSVDFCFSNAVLEHIPRKDFDRMLNEMTRVIKPSGVSVHRVDLKDHLGGGLNNLRFPQGIWESSLFLNSGFYTNRIRFGEMIDAFKKAGFDCFVTRKVNWEKLPLSRSSINGKFNNLPEKDLLVSGFDVVLRHKSYTDVRN